MRFARVAILIASAAVAQRGVFSQLHIGEVTIEVLLVVAIAAGLAAGDQAGAITGFFAGLTLDLLGADGRLGLWALTYAIVGYTVGRWQPTAERGSRLATMGTAALAAAGANVLYVVLARLLDGRDLFGPDLLRISLVAALGAGVLVLPAVRALRWAWAVQPASPARIR